MFIRGMQHFKATEGDIWTKLGLELPISFCQPKQTRIRFPGDSVQGDSSVWQKLEEDWQSFWSSHGREKLGKSGKAAVNGTHISVTSAHHKLTSILETFWVDLVVKNPLDVEISLSALTVSVREVANRDAHDAPDFVQVERIDDITLGAKDTRTVSVMFVVITHPT